MSKIFLYCAIFYIGLIDTIVNSNELTNYSTLNLMTNELKSYKIFFKAVTIVLITFYITFYCIYYLISIHYNFSLLYS